MDKYLSRYFQLAVYAAVFLVTFLFKVVPVHAEQMPILVDFPNCQAEIGNGKPKVSIGIITENANPRMMEFLQKLALQEPDVVVCAESWRSVLPQFSPWSKQLERGFGYVLFLLAFLLTVILAKLRKIAWWRRKTLFGLVSVIGFSWLLGVGFLAAFRVLGGQGLIYDTVVSLRHPTQSEAEWYSISDVLELKNLLEANQLLTIQQIYQAESM